jgi:oxalate decarboxylase/phosphoglucose isomerase-like protein (cupin superfamily)
MSNDHFVESGDVPTQALDWGTLKWMATPEHNDAERFSAGVVQLEPGKGHELHTHPDSEEILFVINGRGEQTVAGETRDIGPGEMVYVPAGVEHGTINTTWETLQLLAVYSPPGPETEIESLPECETLPPGELPGESD